MKGGISLFKEDSVNSALGYHFHLRQQFLIEILHYLVLGLLLPYCPLQICYPDLHSLLTVPVRLGIFITLQSLNVNIDTCLGLDVLHISSAKVTTCLFLYYFGFLEGDLALTFFDVDIGQSHLFVEIFDLVLKLEYLLLTFFLLFQTTKNKVRQFLTQVLTLLALSLNPSLCFPNHFLKSNTLILPTIFDIGRCTQRNLIPNRLFT